MFQFPAFASYTLCIQVQIPHINSWKPEPDKSPVQTFQELEVGCPIRRSMDQSSFAAPHGLSQRITSFFACACQGIHQMPLRHLIVLIANAHHLSGLECQNPNRGYLLQPRRLNDAIDAFGMVPQKDVTPSDIRAIPKTSFSR